MRRGGQYLAHISRPHSSRAVVESLVGAAAEADLAPPRDVERRKGEAHLSQSVVHTSLARTTGHTHSRSTHGGIAHEAVCAISGRGATTTQTTVQESDGPQLEPSLTDSAAHLTSQ